MKIKRSDLSQDFLKEVLDYDPATGFLTWKTKKYSKSVFKGRRAGSFVSTTGYRSIHLFGTTYTEHSLIWFWVNGIWPKGQLDHINQQRDDNRISNLREVSNAENSRNKGLMKTNSTGYQGIWYNKRTRKYVAEITKDGKKVFQKTFNEIEDAIDSREAALKEFGFHENHGK